MWYAGAVARPLLVVGVVTLLAGCLSSPLLHSCSSEGAPLAATIDCWILVDAVVPVGGVMIPVGAVVPVGGVVPVGLQTCSLIHDELLAGLMTPAVVPPVGVSCATP